MGAIMARTGRPPKVKIENLIKDVDSYLEEADPPIVAEYAHLHGITRCYLYQLAEKNEELSNAIKRISEAKEIMLEKKALTGKYSHTMAIFSLKQLGWKDSTYVEQKSDSMLAQLIEGLKESE